MSLSWRLTLWYMGLTSFLVVGFMVVSYQTFSESLRGEIDRTLAERANHVVDAVSVIPNRPIEGISPEVTDEFRSPGVYLQILDTSGDVIAHSFNLGRLELPISEEDKQRLLSGETFYHTVEIEGQPVRLYHQPLRRNNTIFGGVHVGQSLTVLETALNQLFVNYAIGAGIVTILGLVGGWGIAYLGLCPVVRLKQTAQEIVRAEDLDRRVEVNSRNDEIGVLATTFNQMLDRLQTIFDGQKRFLAETAHELRTPLSSMLGNVDLLVRFGDNPIRKQETINALQRTGRHVSRLLDDLLLLAQAEAGWKLHLQPIAIDDLLLEVYEEMLLVSADIHSPLQLKRCDSALVMGDADRLRQVFINLIENAVKYSSPESVVVLEMWASEKCVWFTISNMGLTIAPEELQRIFEPFFRASNQKRPAGVGLGLTIVEWIVRQHSGKIIVESSPECGTRVIVSLPEHTN